MSEFGEIIDAFNERFSGRGFGLGEGPASFRVRLVELNYDLELVFSYEGFRINIPGKKFASVKEEQFTKDLRGEHPFLDGEDSIKEEHTEECEKGLRAAADKINRPMVLALFRRSVKTKLATAVKAVYYYIYKDIKGWVGVPARTINGYIEEAQGEEWSEPFTKYLRGRIAEKERAMQEPEEDKPTNSVIINTARESLKEMERMMAADSELAKVTIRVLDGKGKPLKGARVYHEGGDWADDHEYLGVTRSNGLIIVKRPVGEQLVDVQVARQNRPQQLKVERNETENKLEFFWNKGKEE